VPPEQCPACGRFLKRALVDGLADSPAPCPRCGIELSAAMFPAVPGADDGPPPAPPAALAEAPAAPSVIPATPVAPEAPSIRPPDLPPAAPSIRPPDLPPADVRDEPDPLAGWDAGVPSGAAVVRDERPFPTDTVAVAAATVAGAALGAVFGRRPVRDAVLAGLGGAVGAGVARRIWQLP
jgi:hypothetical protein